MKAKSLLLLFGIALAVVTGGCTQNNGHIGKLFGTWVLTGTVIGEETSPLDDGCEAYLSFQNNIARMLTVCDSYGVDEEKYATWTQSGDNLVLDFSHTADGNLWDYDVPSWLYPEEEKINFTVTYLDGGKLELLRTVGEDIYVYSFSKTW